MKTALPYLMIISLSLPALGATNLKWAQKMQALKSAMEEALPDIVSEKPLTSEETKKLQRAAKTVADLAHNIDMKGDKSSPLPPDADPSVRFISGMFSRQANYANGLLKSGHTDAGRNVLRVLTGYCIACHTRGDHGPEFPKMELKPALSKLTPMEKGDLFAATRQFDAAFDQYSSVVGDTTTAAKKQLEWGRAARRGLMVSVRALKDPAKAEKLLNQIVNEKGESKTFVPQFYKMYVASWKKAVEEWKSEGAKKPSSESAYLNEAKRLLNAGKEIQKYPMDNSADVYYLRASSVLHEMLIRYPHGSLTPEAMYLQGQAYMVLSDPQLSLLPDMYYESCIRSAPHTPESLKCYNAFEESVYVGYSGSGGTSIPNDLSKVMTELKALATPG